MSYNARRFIQYTDRYDVVQRFEIQELDYAGSATEIQTSNGINFEHEELPTGESILKLYENPIQKGALQLDVLIKNSTDEQLVQDIFDGEEDQFRLVWKQDGATFWTGSVLNDLLETSEMPLASKPSVSIYAKDFSRLEGIDYTNTGAGRGTIIEIIAELLTELGYSLEIETITSWISENTTSSTDFLQQHYIDRFALQTYARTGDESNENITCLEALEKICRNFCLVLKQVGGVWLLEQYSAYSDSENVYLTVYNTDGTQKTATTQTDVTGNASTTIKGTSRTKQYPGLKSARVKYDHRTKISGIQFPDIISVDSTDTTEEFTQVIQSDGTQTISFLLSAVRADSSEGVTESSGRFIIQAGSYFYDVEDDAWEGGSVTNTFDLVNTTSKPGLKIWAGSIGFETTTLPADADGTLTISIINATNADETDYAASISIIGAVADENSTSIDYKLTQTGNFSERYQHGDDWFGDAPTGYSRGAISTDSSAANLTVDDWQRRGTESNYRNFHENSLKEVLDVQRTGIKRIEANTEDGYDPRKVKSYRGSNYVYGGGTYNGDTWNPVLIQINIQSGTDTFEDIPKFISDQATGSTGATTGGGVPSGTYFQVANNLSEGTPSTMLTNLGLTATASELNRLDGSLSTVQGNLGLKDGSAELDLLSADIGDLSILDNRIQNTTGGVGIENVLITDSVISSRVAGEIVLSDVGRIEDTSGNVLEFDGAGNVVFPGNVTIGTSGVGADLHVFGNIFQDGDTYETHVEQLYTEKDFIISRDGAAGGLAAGEISGLQVNIADGINDVVFGVDSNAVARVGWESDTLQAIATRPDAPTDNGIAVWDDTNNWYETRTGFTFDGTDLVAPGDIEAVTFSIGATTINGTELGILNTLGGMTSAQATGLVGTSGTATFYNLTVAGTSNFGEIASGNITAGFGSIDIGTSDLIAGSATVTDLAIGTTGHGFDSSGNVKSFTTEIDTGEYRRISDFNGFGVESTFFFTTKGSGTVLNKPPGTNYLSGLNVGGYGTGISAFQIASQREINELWYRSGNSSSDTWQDWVRLWRTGDDIDANSYLINATTVIDSSRNGFLNSLNINSNAIQLNSDGTSSFSGDLTAQSNITLTTGNIGTNNFSLTTDFTGTGWQGTYAGDFNINNLVVRSSARFRELIIDQLSVIAGSDLRSVGRGKIKDVDNTAKTVTLDNPRNISASSFIDDKDDGSGGRTSGAGDFFWIKEIDIDGSTFLDLKGQITAVTTTTVSGEEVIKLTLDTTVTGGTHEGTTTDLSALNGGEVIVQRGHPTDADRQALIYTTVSDSDAPVQKYFTGIDSLAAFDSVANISTQIGNLEGLTSTYANVTGEGFYSSNAYLTDSLLIGSMDKSGSYLEVTGTDINAVGLNLDVTSLPRVSDGGLLGLWRFDETTGNTAIDGTGRNNGTHSGDYEYVYGVSGEAIRYNTDVSATTISDDTFLNPTNYITISLWFRASNLRDTNEELIVKGSGLGDNEYGVYLRRSGLGSIFGTRMNIGGSSVTIQPSSPSGNSNYVSESAWYHIVARYDGNNLSLWVNGEKYGEVSATGVLANGAGNLVVGDNTQGDIDEIRIYNRGLPDNEIKSLYLYPSGNSGGLISADTVVATQGFFEDLFAEEATITGGFLKLNGAYIADASDKLYIDNSNIALGASASSQTLASGAGFFADISGDVRIGDTTSAHTLIDDTGIYFKNGADVAAQLTGTTFLLGDNTGNHLSFDVSDGSGEIDFDTFLLEAGDLSIDSSDPSIKMTEGANDALLIDTTETGTSEFDSILTSEFVTMDIDFGEPSDAAGNLTVEWSGSLQVNGLNYSKYIQLTKINLRHEGVGSEDIDLNIRVDGFLPGAGWRNIVPTTMVLQNQTITDSLADYTLDKAIEFYSDPIYTSYRVDFEMDLTGSPASNVEWLFVKLYSKEVINQTHINKTNVDATSLRVKRKVEIIDAFDTSNKATLQYIEDDGEWKLQVVFYVGGDLVQISDIATYTP